MWSIYEVEVISTWARTAIARVRSSAKDERGEIAQTVIIVAILAAAAIAIATIIATKFRDKANNIPTQ
jgi:hypothetical protein